LIDIIKQQLQTSLEAYSCCRFTRALALYTQLAALPAAPLPYPCAALYPRFSALPAAPLPYPQLRCLTRSFAALPAASLL